MKYKIFLVEDDSALAGSIKNHLESWGYEVFIPRDLKQVIKDFKETNPHAVLLDVMLPFYDGYYWCREIRKLSNVPVVFISSATDNMNIIMAINMGGDDFICKPFDAGVLMAKLQAVLRRAYDMSGKIDVLEIRGAVLNLNDFTLQYEDKVVELTKNEFRILETLMSGRGKIVSRDTLMMKLWQDDCYVEENTLTVNVTRLRKRLEDIGLTDFIKTKVGSGYYIAATASETK